AAGACEGDPQRGRGGGRPAALRAVLPAVGPRRAPVPPLELSRAELAELLGRGQIEVVGRLRYSSNGAFFVRVCANGVELPAVYKPRRGERPLWDFRDGTHSRREVAACILSDGLGWDVVPVTVHREDGPLGE